jgi:hypothetical protein
MAGQQAGQDTLSRYPPPPLPTSTPPQVRTSLGRVWRGWQEGVMPPAGNSSSHFTLQWLYGRMVLNLSSSLTFSTESRVPCGPPLENNASLFWRIIIQIENLELKLRGPFGVHVNCPTSYASEKDTEGYWDVQIEQIFACFVHLAVCVFGWAVCVCVQVRFHCVRQGWERYLWMCW